MSKNSLPTTLPAVRKPGSRCLGCRRGIRLARTSVRVGAVLVHVGQHGTLEYVCREAQPRA